MRLEERNRRLMKHSAAPRYAIYATTNIHALNTPFTQEISLAETLFLPPVENGDDDPSQGGRMSRRLKQRLVAKQRAGTISLFCVEAHTLTKRR